MPFGACHNIIHTQARSPTCACLLYPTNIVPSVSLFHTFLRIFLGIFPSKVEVLGRDCSLNLAPGGTVKAVEPAGPLSVAKEGVWELDDRVVRLDYKR